MRTVRRPMQAAVLTATVSSWSAATSGGPARSSRPFPRRIRVWTAAARTKGYGSLVTMAAMSGKASRSAPVPIKVTAHSRTVSSFDCR